MIIKPRTRGFICTTAHPKGCAANVQNQIDHVLAAGPIEGAKKALIIGASGGYGLASRIVLAYGCGADTLGVSFEKPPTDTKTATAGWYNNRAFESRAAKAGRYANTLDGDAFSDAMKDEVIRVIKADLGQIDMLVYSLASPVRQHPRSGELFRSAIKPLTPVSRLKSLNVQSGEVSEVDLDPAEPEELAGTIAVMGGEDWEFWIEALADAGVLAEGFRTVSYTYIGCDLTWPIYWEGTLGKAKEDLDRAAAALRQKLAGLGGDARVAVLKAVVTQASSAIPVVPLYVALLFRVMKESGVHEDCIDHIYRLFSTQLYGTGEQRLDEAERIRLDDLELADDIQVAVRARWPDVNTDNVMELGDVEGIREDFMRIFGFGLEGVDYDEDLDPTVSG